MVGNERSSDARALCLSCRAPPPIGLHYQWSHERAERVIQQIRKNINTDPEHYSTEDVQKSRAALSHFAWLVPLLLGGLYVLSFATAEKRLWLRRFFPAVAVGSYVFAVEILLSESLGRHEALFHLADMGKMTVWVLIPCAGLQVGLLTYVWAAPIPNAPRGSS